MATDEHTLAPWVIDADTVISLRLKQAREALASGNASLALVEAEELLSELPDQAEALFMSGEAALLMRDAAMAESAFERFLDLSPQHAAAMEGLAVARFEQVNFPGAEEAANAAVALDGRRARAWHYLGLVRERLGDPDGAMEAFDQALRLAPKTYLPPRSFSDVAWEDALARGRKNLPGPIRAFYARVPVIWESFPAAADLLSQHPPLSPLSYALYEGTPTTDGDPWTETPRAVRLYRGNLRHGADLVEDLAQRIGDALLQEAAAWIGLDAIEND